jgi:hypothetical protein
MVCVVTLGDSQAPGLSFFPQLGVGIVIRIPDRTHLTHVAGVVLAQVLTVGVNMSFSSCKLAGMEPTCTLGGTQAPGLPSPPAACGDHVTDPCYTNVAHEGAIPAGRLLSHEGAQT